MLEILPCRANPALLISDRISGGARRPEEARQSRAQKLINP